MLRSKKKLQKTFIQIYEEKCQSESFKHDQKQLQIVKQLDNLHQNLTCPFYLAFNKNKQQGIYLFGTVGSGKSMIMDLFFQHSKIEKKLRIHFHQFMQNIHDEIHEWRQIKHKNKDSALLHVAKKISKETKLLCFDEFQVNDVADALILGQLFSYLFQFKVFVFATSNRHPDDLYLGGIQREKFLEFVGLFKNKLAILELSSQEDYRKQALKSLQPLYFFPNNKKNQDIFNNLFNEITDNSQIKPQNLKHKGRLIHLAKTYDKITKIAFSELFEENLNSSDFQLITQQFSNIFLTNIRKITIEESDIAKRFINFIDVCYEAKTKLIIIAECKEEEIYQKGKYQFEFSRTISRLKEMQSSHYSSIST